MDNYASLARLHAECFPGKQWGAQDFALLQKSGAQIIMSENAFVVWRQAADEAEIITIGVAPNMRRTGTASAVLTLMQQELQKTGCKKIFLEVANNNTAAIKLYENNGFVCVSVRPKYYDGIDALVMRKEI